MRGRAAIRGRSAACFAALALACAPAGGGWDWRALERAHPELARQSGERLRDASPYPRPVPDEDVSALDLVLCRWSARRAIAVALPPDADSRESALLTRALRAWEDAGLGVRFAVGATPPDIEIRFVEEGEGSAWPRTAYTAADCRVDDVPELVRARIWLDRANLDPLGRPQPLSETEMLGTALHEIGHALGFQGHVATGSSVMVRETDRVRRAGRQVLAGDAFVDASLRALYAVPTGERVGRVTLSAAGARALGRLQERADREGYAGPFSRVGDRVARVFWVGPGGDEVGVILRPWPIGSGEGEALAVRPDRAARAWLSDR